MSYGIINPSDEQRRAWAKLSWDQVCSQDPEFARFTSLANALKGRVCFSDQALAMLGSLNDHDRVKVLQEIIGISRHPNPKDAKSHWRNPFVRFIKSRYPFPHYHFFINYSAEPDGTIWVMEIFFDEILTGSQKSKSNERPMLYEVSRIKEFRYEKPITRDESRTLNATWQIENPVSQISTDYAAVNGMLNEIGKAAWLMGIHIDNAYRNANPNSYTLYHNPTQGGFEDIIECIWDKSPSATNNASHLGAILRQTQKQNRKTKWLVHSQGALIFNSAVALHNMHFGTPLSCHSVAIHAPGANIEMMRKNLIKANIEISRIRQNPFDLVPNIAGTNNLEKSSLLRCLQFSGLIVRKNGGHLGVSPHTLPYLGIKTYQKQLELAGFTRKAREVKRYIEKRDQARIQRRGW
jgi:hypothetical protein